jgi:hypothetical protein
MAAIAIGLAIAAIAQVTAGGSRPPLYDGVVVQDSYRYLVPGQGQAGSPASFTGTRAAIAGTSPGFAAATAESPPQAQLIAPDGAFALAPGSSTLRISILPVPAERQPLDGTILGNVYRVAVTDERGATVAIVKPVTLVLRAPEGASVTGLARLGPTGWVPVATQPGGLPGMFYADASVLGDMALVGTSAATPPAPGIDVQFLLVPVLGGLALGVALIALLAVRRRAGRGPGL